MNRRLYFMFPSKHEAGAAINELATREGVNRSRMHVLARDGIDVSGLPLATLGPRRDLRARIAWWMWEGGPGLFTAALLGLLLALIALIAGSAAFAVLAIVILVVTFVSGVIYATRLPDVSLEEFRGALAHGELLLMVDVPRSRVAAVEQRMVHHHPAAVARGSSWVIEGFTI